MSQKMLIFLIVIEIILLIFLGYLIIRDRGKIGEVVAPIYPGSRLVGENRMENLIVHHYISDGRQGDVALFYQGKLSNFLVLSNHHRGNSLFFSLLNPLAKKVSNDVDVPINISAFVLLHNSAMRKGDFLGVEVLGAYTYTEFALPDVGDVEKKTLINIWHLAD